MPTTKSDLAELYSKIVDAIRPMRPESILADEAIDSDDEGSEELTSGFLDSAFLDDFLELEENYCEYTLEEFVIALKDIFVGIRENLIENMDPDRLTEVHEVVDRLTDPDLLGLRDILTNIVNLAGNIETINAARRTFGVDGVLASLVPEIHAIADGARGPEVDGFDITVITLRDGAGAVAAPDETPAVGGMLPAMATAGMGDVAPGLVGVAPSPFSGC